MPVWTREMIVQHVQKCLKIHKTSVVDVLNNGGTSIVQNSAIFVKKTDKREKLKQVLFNIFNLIPNIVAVYIKTPQNCLKIYMVNLNYSINCPKFCHFCQENEQKEETETCQTLS